MHGVRFKANPTKAQKLTLSQWMGCSKFIWNAKCSEERYYSIYAKKYCSLGIYAPIDTKTAHFKDKTLSPWLYDCPSQVLRNSATNWYKTYQNFIKGICGKPRHKPKSNNGSMYLTREVFDFSQDEFGTVKLFIGTKKNNIGYLSFKAHRKYKIPKSIYIKKRNGIYSVSFSYETLSKNNNLPKSEAERFKLLKKKTHSYLESNTVGIDRGVAIPVQAGNDSYNLNITGCSDKKLIQYRNKVKRLQRKLSKQKKASTRRFKTKLRLSKAHKKISSVRKDFCHKVSHNLVYKTNNAIFVLEKLNTKNMTKSAKGILEKPGKNVKAKSGLNRSILDKNWFMFESMMQYKSLKNGKVCFKVAAPYTSQTCAIKSCQHRNPNNRKTQSIFECVKCGNRDNADRNAAKVIKQKALTLISNHSGTELLGRGIPMLSSIERGSNKESINYINASHCDDPLKKKVKTPLLVAV